MIWVAVFPTLTLLNLLLSDLLAGLPIVARTFILVSIAVPVVIYAVMPQLHRIRRMLTRRARSRPRHHRGQRDRILKWQ